MTRLRNTAVARSTSRAWSSNSCPALVKLEGVGGVGKMIFFSWTRTSKAEHARENGSDFSHVRVISLEVTVEMCHCCPAQETREPAMAATRGAAVASPAV